MVRIHTIGYQKRGPEDFFGALRAAGIKTVADVRRNNTSQLSGFTKKGWIEYFLREIVGAAYLHLVELAPDQALLKAFSRREIPWEQYAAQYLDSLRRQRVEQHAAVLELRGQPAVLLCAERDPVHCHRRLAAEYLAEAWGDVEIVHL